MSEMEGIPTGQGGEQRRAEEALVPELRPGLSAIPFPDLRVAGKQSFGRAPDGSERFNVIKVEPTPDQALAGLNKFLGALNEQGATLVQVVGVPTLVEGKGVDRDQMIPVETKLAIVNKAQPQPGTPS